jgi:hypothetical protein
MFKAIYLFWLRNVCVISNDKAKKLKLTHFKNIYGDGINAYGCRSFWEDDKGRLYRVENLENE